MNTIKILVLNGIIISAVLMYLVLLRPLPYDFTYENWPSHVTIILQIAFFILIEDFLFYVSHRMLHHPQLYWIHKHHHEYRQTIAVAAQYAHPL